LDLWDRTVFQGTLAITFVDECLHDGSKIETQLTLGSGGLEPYANMPMDNAECCCSVLVPPLAVLRESTTATVVHLRPLSKADSLRVS
ncbi:hypothetical protein KCU88_g15, partial [Aureobasidium melanogenum]